jgi:hypothetical protein
MKKTATRHDVPCDKIYYNAIYLCRLIFSCVCYSLHPFQNYFLVNPTSYTVWLVTPDRWYPAYLLDLRTRPPPFSVDPSSPKSWQSVETVISPTLLNIFVIL